MELEELQERQTNVLNEIRRFDSEINSLIEFKKNNEKAKLIIVTYDEEKVINQNDVIINVISLKNFLLSKI